jgi:adenosylcobinamide-GDP ribazoletransferase
MKRTLYLPLVGIIVGGIAGLVFAGTDALFDSKGLAVIVSIAASMAITGAFLETGSIATMVGVLIKYQSLLLIPSRSIPFVLIAAHAFSRFAAGSLTLAYPKTHSGGVMSTPNFLIMASLGMLPLLLVGSLLFLLFVPLLWIVRSLFGVWLGRKDGGYTNERLVSTQHAVEVCFYLLVIVAYKFAFDFSSI